MLNKFKSVLSKKKVWIPLLVIMVLVMVFMFRNGNGNGDSMISPEFGVLKKTVEATGQVVSNTDLDLAFPKTGVVSSVKVKVGQKVRSGTVLATLDSGSDYAALTKARGALAVAEAKLKKTLEGSSNEEIALARVALENANRDLENTRRTQATLVDNAYNALLNSTLEMLLVNSTSSSVTAPTITGTYKNMSEGQIKVDFYNSSSGTTYALSGLATGTGYVNTNLSQELGNTGLYISFSEDAGLVGTNWVINIPNKKASDYLTNENIYLSAVKTRDASIATAESLVSTRQAEFDLKVAAARDSDIDLAEAEVLSAKGEVERAQSVYNDNVLRSGGSGTVTNVDIKYGELATSNTPVITIEDVDNLYIEAQINESNIASLVLGQMVDVTFDALVGETFTGKISHIDPSAITSDGIVNYKVKVSINEESDKIRPGMNAEISVTTFEKPDVLSIPKAAVSSRDGKDFVNVVVDEVKYRTNEVEVTLGASGDGGKVEILSGLSASDKILFEN